MINPELLTSEQREKIISSIIWTFEVEGIKLTREEAETALDWALAQPLPEF